MLSVSYTVFEIERFDLEKNDVLLNNKKKMGILFQIKKLISFFK